MKEKLLNATIALGTLNTMLSIALLVVHSLDPVAPEWAVTSYAFITGVAAASTYVTIRTKSTL